MLIQEIVEWSERITQTATLVLNRGSDEDKIELRKLISEWIDKYEPVLDAFERKKYLVIDPPKSWQPGKMKTDAADN